jgi:hypothetical protein
MDLRHYSGASDSQKIRSFIIDARQTWGTTYFLLGGEHEAIPFCYRTYCNGESTPSDEYYSDYDDDWGNEAYVGRVSVGNYYEINAFVSKILKYEKDPPRTNYPLDVLLIGMDTDASTPEQVLMDTIDHHIPARFNVTKVYDSHGGTIEIVLSIILMPGKTWSTMLIMPMKLQWGLVTFTTTGISTTGMWML